ncbi:hypothetical protein T4B_12358, partial [Trichinella pseudospiralis]
NTANTFYRIEENQKLLNGNCKHANDVRQPNKGNVFTHPKNIYLFYLYFLKLSSCIENDFYAIKGNLATRYVSQTTQDAFRLQQIIRTILSNYNNNTNLIKQAFSSEKDYSEI